MLSNDTNLLDKFKEVTTVNTQPRLLRQTRMYRIKTASTAF